LRKAACALSAGDYFVVVTCMGSSAVSYSSGHTRLCAFAAVKNDETLAPIRDNHAPFGNPFRQQIV
jgi:hypothetical protein